jgi:hypothetical protein
MAQHKPYQNHPLLARFDRGWRQYAAMYGVVDMLLWRAYLAYLADHDDWCGDPLWYHQWLAAHEELALIQAYAEYAALEAQPLSFEAWLIELERVAGVLDQPSAGAEIGGVRWLCI